MSSSATSRFGDSILSRLDAKIAPKHGQAGVAQAQRIALSLIDEDPEQPRRTFPEAELQQLAASIRMVVDGAPVGVLQPIGITPTQEGRYLLRWGARRVRASLLAGLADIPAVLVGEGQKGLEAQVMENRHRTPNADSELAAAVATLTQRGMKNAEIATVLALPDPQSLKHYRSLTKLHETAPELVPWIDQAPVRALYELANAWQSATAEQRAVLIEFLEALDEVTVTSARRLMTAVAAQKVSIASEALAATASMTSHDAEGVAASEPATIPLPMSAKRKVKADDIDAERLAIVRAWIDDPARPRPPLNV